MVRGDAGGASPRGEQVGVPGVRRRGRSGLTLPRGVLAGVVVVGSLLAGCPRELQPPPPGDAPTCVEHTDCNDGGSCGELSLCVGGFCEETPSLAVPCPGEGVPIE